MSLEMRIAAAHELEELFRLRYRVFVEEMRYFPENPERRISDSYDWLPSTRNFAVLIDGCIVGGIRSLTVSGTETPIDDYFDFRSYLAGKRGLAVTAGMFFVLPGYRRLGRTALSILHLLSDYALNDGISYIVAAVAPEAEGVGRRVGYEYLAPRFFHETKHLWVSPMVLDLSAQISQELPLASNQELPGKDGIQHPYEIGAKENPVH